MTFSDLWRILRQKPTLQAVKPIKIGKSDDEKALEIEERRNEIELNRLKISEAKRARFRKELDDIHTDITDDTQDYEDDEESDDVPEWLAPFMPIITQKLQGINKTPNSVNQAVGIAPDAYTDSTTQQQFYTPPIISDDELRGFLNQLPKSQLKMAKIMPKPALYNIINQKMPLSQQDFERGYQILVTEY